MNACDLEVLITVAVRGRFYDHQSLNSAHNLEGSGFIEPRTMKDGLTIDRNLNTFKLTEKGRIMVNALVSIPEPVLAYTMPGKE